MWFGHVWHMYRSSPWRSTLNTGYIRFGHVWHMYRSSPWRSTLNTGYIRFGHVWHMNRSSPLRSTLNTGYIRFGHVWHMNRSSPWRSTLNTGYIRFGHVWHMNRSSPLRSTLNTGYIRFGHVWHLYRSSPWRSTLNTGYIRFGHVWHMYRSSPWRSTLNTGYIRFGHVRHICIPCTISSIERKMMNSSAPLLATWAIRTKYGTISHIRTLLRPLKWCIFLRRVSHQWNAQSPPWWTLHQLSGVKVPGPWKNSEKKTQVFVFFLSIYLAISFHRFTVDEWSLSTMPHHKLNKFILSKIKCIQKGW